MFSRNPRCCKPMQTPSAPKKPRFTTLHGVEHRDDYAWLRDENWQATLKDPALLAPEIRAYLEAENAYADAVMTPTKKLEDALYRELHARITEDDSSVPDRDGEFAYYTRWKGGTQYPVFCRCPARNARFSPGAALEGEEVLLDANLEARNHDYFRVGACVHSPDHRLLAYCIDGNGSEFYTLYIRDLAAGRLLDERIERVQPDVVWSNDGRNLVYAVQNDNHRPEYVAVHRLGEAVDDDRVVYREPDPGFFVKLGKTRLRRFITIDAHDHVTSEVHLLDASDGAGETRLVAARETGVEYAVEERANTLIIMTNADGAEDYKLVTAPLASPERANWRDLVVPKTGVLLEDFLVAHGFLVRAEREQALPRLVIAELDERNRITREHAIALQEEAYELDVVHTADAESDELRFAYTSMTTPPRVYDYDVNTREQRLRKQKHVPGHDPDDFVTRRLHAPAPDGETVPLSLTYAKSTPLDGTAPLLLYGYGAYGHSTPAAFSANRASLLERGFIYAVAHVRGGMEKGYAWYRNGRLGHKTNTFSDFIAAAEHLIRKGFTAAGNIAVHGGSAGGMLIGAVLNQRPDLFRAAVADVPFVDVLNTMCDADLPLTPPEWPEWGNPIEDEAAYRTIAAYSPYDNVKAQAYPHVLVTAGVSDPRVTYWEPAKWVAKLREMKTDDNHLLLKTNLTAGHGGASGRLDYLKEVALMYAFVLGSFGDERGSTS